MELQCVAPECLVAECLVAKGLSAFFDHPQRGRLRGIRDRGLRISARRVGARQRSSPVRQRRLRRGIVVGTRKCKEQGYERSGLHDSHDQSSGALDMRYETKKFLSRV